jgi:hypothetical protein
VEGVPRQHDERARLLIVSRRVQFPAADDCKIHQWLTVEAPGIEDDQSREAGTIEQGKARLAFERLRPTCQIVHLSARTIVEM